MTDKITIDLDDLTLGEMDDFEKASGIGVQDLQDGSMPTQAVIALVWLSQRRANPKYTIEDARKVRMSELDFDGNPTPAKPGKPT